MILIKNTKKTEVLESLEREYQFALGMKDTLALLRDSGTEAMATVESYIEKNAVMKGIQNNLRRSVDTRTDLLGFIDFSINNLSAFIPKLKAMIEKASTKTYDTETISFKDRGMLDTVSSINFWNRYTGMMIDILLNVAYEEQDLKKMLNKVDFTFFNDNPPHYIHLTERFCQPTKTLVDMIEALSDELADELSEQILEGNADKNLVSIRNNLAPHQLNPQYWFKLWQMRRDVNHMAVAREQIELMAMKIARINNRRGGNEDPALDRQIEVYENTILKKRAKIDSIVEKWNG